MIREKGVALISLIVIIGLLAIIAGGIASYITEALRYNVATVNNDKAFFMAQAGIMRAIVDYRDGGLWSSARNVSAGGECFYHVGEDSNFLWVDASGSQLVRLPDKSYSLQRIPIKNINVTNPITITSMIVEWTGATNLIRVTLGGTTVWTGNRGSPADVDISDFMITAGRTYGGDLDQEWVFSKKIGNAIATFVFSGGSRYKTYISRPGATLRPQFSVSATGEIRGESSTIGRRSLTATYDTARSLITSWEESARHIR